LEPTILEGFDGVMHAQKNVCETLVGTLLDIPGKTKDTLKEWMNLEDMKLRNDLHQKILENGSKKLPTTCYTIRKQENMSLYNCLHRIKVLSAYSANVSRFANMKTLKMHFKKSNNCHTLMVQLILVAIRGTLPEKV
jgi:hypothetical protein